MRTKKLLSIMKAVFLSIQPSVVYASTGSISTPRGRYITPGGGSGSVT